MYYKINQQYKGFAISTILLAIALSSAITVGTVFYYEGTRSTETEAGNTEIIKSINSKQYTDNFKTMPVSSPLKSSVPDGNQVKNGTNSVDLKGGLDVTSAEINVKTGNIKTGFSSTQSGNSDLGNISQGNSGIVVSGSGTQPSGIPAPIISAIPNAPSCGQFHIEYTSLLLDFQASGSIGGFVPNATSYTASWVGKIVNPPWNGKQGSTSGNFMWGNGNGYGKAPPQDTSIGKVSTQVAIEACNSVGCSSATICPVQTSCLVQSNGHPPFPDCPY